MISYSKSKKKRRAQGKQRTVSPAPTTKWEHRFGYPQQLVIGVDEVGRGCLAGPVVAGAVVLPAVVDRKTDQWLLEVNDSKLVKAHQREELEPLLKCWVRSFAVGIASVEEIEQINILNASHLAMQRAVAEVARQLGASHYHVLVDGKLAPKELGPRVTPIVKGDQKSLSIAAASLLAKVWRDRLMVEMDEKYPGYGMAKHKGYFTKVHREALLKQGPCEIHRKTFAPVVNQLKLF